MIRRVKGTQDFLDLRLFNFIIEQVTQHLTRYHFTNILLPIIEHTELFKRSLGTHTDVVSKEMFLIAPRDHDEEESICLRPEATAQTVRAFIENQVQTTPWKVFTWGPMFRYERPQKGRFRQFNQVSIEIIGSPEIAHDVQLITMLERLFHETIKMNNYAILINFLGCQEDRAKFKLILAKFLTKVSDKICSTCQARRTSNILRIFDCKTESCQHIYQDAPHTADHLCKTCEQEWTAIQQQLHMLSVSYTYQPTLVRGLDYYCKTVFEFVSNNLGAQNTFCGGGRYDQLVKELGGEQDQPSLGAAIGIERLMLILEPFMDKLALPELPALQVIIPMSKEQHMLALLLADTMRAAHLCVEVLLEQDSMKSMLRKANKLGATHCLILGSEEQATGTVTIKQMITGEQECIAQTDVVNFLKK